MLSDLKELSALKAGWLDGEGEALSKKGLAWLAEMLMKHFSDSAEKPYIYPTPEGGVALEWQAGGAVRHSASLEIDIDARKGEWVSGSAPPDNHAALDLSSDAGWKRLLKLVPA